MQTRDLECQLCILQNIREKGVNGIMCSLFQRKNTNVVGGGTEQTGAES